MDFDSPDDDWNLDDEPSNEASLPLRRKKKKPRKKKFKPKPLGNETKARVETPATQKMEFPATIWIAVIVMGIEILISAVWIVARIVTGNGFALGSLLKMIITGSCGAGIIFRRSEARLITIFLSAWEIFFSLLLWGFHYAIANATEGRSMTFIENMQMVMFPLLIVLIGVKICVLSLRDREGYFID